MPSDLQDLVARCRDVEASHVIETGKLSNHEATALRAALQAASFYVATIDAAESDEPYWPIIAVGEAFRFPAYYGENWDAMDECLADLDWIEENAYCCIFRRSAVLRARDNQSYETLLDVFRYAADSWRSRGVPCKLILA